eukprot:COSAG02_NODE_1953_length_10277_cov_3.865003_6_plen_521_part_00
MRLAVAVQRVAQAGPAVPCRRAGFLSGLKEMVGGSAKSRREFPSAEVPHSTADRPDVSKLSGLELSKHQMLKQRALEAEMLAQREASGQEDATAIPEDFKRSLLSTPMVQNQKLDINAEGVETVLGNEAWAATTRRQLPQAPSKEDLGTRLLGEAGLLSERVADGMLDAHNVWAFLNGAAELRAAGEPVEKQENLGARAYRLSQAQASALVSSHSTVIVLMNETGTKRLGACAVPASIADGSAGGWKVATEEEDGAGATLTPRQATLNKQSRDDHELTDAQRAARGLGLPPRPSATGGGDGGGDGSAPGLPWQRHVDELELEETSSGAERGDNNQQLVGWEDITVAMTKSASGLGLDIGVACDVDAVAADSEGEAAGVSVGDVIVGINGVDVENREMLVALVSSVRMGDRFTMNVSRPQQAAVGEETEAGTARRPEEGERRALGVFWEGPEGAEYGFGGSAEDEIISQAAKSPGAWVTDSGMVICIVVAGNGKYPKWVADSHRMSSLGSWSLALLLLSQV